MLLCQILATTIYGKILKSHIKTTNLKYLIQRRMIILNYIMDLILSQIFKISLSISLKSIKGTLTDI